MIFVSTHPIEEATMASARLRHLLKFLSKQNRQVICICPEGPPSQLATWAGITICSIPGATKWSFVVKAAKEIVQRVGKNADEIVVSSIPGIQSLMAAFLARMFSRVSFRLILEVRDPFSLNPALPWSGLKRAIGHRIESMLLRSPDRAIFLTSIIQSIYVNGFPGDQPWKSVNAVITNGYPVQTEIPRKKEKTSAALKLTYTGHFYDRRHPIEFLTALRDYLGSHADVTAPYVQMAGEIHGEDLQRRVREVCKDPHLQKCVHWLGTIPHDESTQLMQDSDINLLITHDQGSEYAIPGKLFEYMGARRPVLAMTHDPLVKQLMNETHLGWVCEDRTAITQWFSAYLNNRSALQNWQPDDQAASAYQLETLHPRWLNFVEGRTC